MYCLSFPRHAEQQHRATAQAGIIIPPFNDREIGRETQGYNEDILSWTDSMGEEEDCIVLIWGLPPSQRLSTPLFLGGSWMKVRRKSKMK